MSRSNINTLAINIIKNNILDELAIKFKGLDLDEDTMGEINKLVDDERCEEPKKSKKKTIKLHGPKREIAPENQCQRLMKNGNKCGSIRTNRITNSCWAHMTEKEKDEHRKGMTKKSSGKYSFHRAEEDKVDE